MDKPDTGYLSLEFFEEGEVGFDIDLERRVEKIDFFPVKSIDVADESTCQDCGLPFSGCRGITNALVCFKRLRSLQRAEIKGRSRFLLFSLNELMSKGVSGGGSLRGGDFRTGEVNPAVLVSSGSETWKIQFSIINYFYHKIIYEY